MYDEIFRPQPQEGKTKQYQARLDDVPKDIYHVS